MSTIKHIISILAISIMLVGCTYSVPAYFTNTTSSDVIVASGNLTYTVKPGKIRKIRGVQYEKLKIEFDDGVIKFVTADDLAFLNNWQEYQGKYICSGFLGAKINITIAVPHQLIVQPCSSNHEPMAL